MEPRQIWVGVYSLLTLVSLQEGLSSRPHAGGGVKAL